MKFLQFYRDGRPTLGVITEKGVVDMSAHPELPQTMLALCQSGDTAALAALDGPYLDEESLTLAPVVTGMEKILCIGLNYRAHAAECGIPLPENPTVFCKLPNALAAHGQAIALPAAEEIDYEAELVLVMGEGGRVSPAPAATTSPCASGSARRASGSAARRMTASAPSAPMPWTRRACPREGSGSPAASTASCASTRIPLT